MEPEKKKHLVCAIYTRKSTTEGLEQDFTSLDNQRESAENYIKSQQHEGWTASEEQYNDGGFTGANTERPGLQKLLNHIKEGRINCVVVYKVDRLSRSLLDFSQLLEFFEKHSVVFVSITQQFNTNTSMGRLTLNILLSFAQFEREIISERTRDKMSAARKRGQWLGGHPPYGYVRNPKEMRKIIVNPEEAEMVKRIYDLYLNKVDSALEIVQILNQEGHRTPSFTSKTNRVMGNKKYNIVRILRILKNHTYIGKVNYKGQIYQGQQPAIIDEETFNKAQEKIASHRLDRKAYKNTGCSGLLSKIIKCHACGSAMVHTYTLKKSRHKYRYYLCTNAQKRGYDECPNRYVNAQMAEDAVIDLLRRELKNKKSDESTEREALLSPICDTLFFEEKKRIIQTLLKEINCDAKNQKFGLLLNGATEWQTFDVKMKTENARKRNRKERQIAEEPAIRKTLLLAYQIKQLLDEGKIKHPREVCTWIHINKTRLDQIMNTLFLCPKIQESILSNDPSVASISEFNIRDLARNAVWNDQLRLWQKLLANNS